MSKIINLGIKPVHYDFLGCMEDALISVAEWSGYRYEILFSGAWTFLFDLDEYNLSQNLGASIKVNPVFIGKPAENLAKYHGIQLEISRDTSFEKVTDLIRCEIENNRPVLVFIDAFFCPWDWNYEQLHITHAFVIAGIGDNGVLFCCDGYHQTCQTITKEELERMYSGRFGKFSFAGNEKVDVDWREVLENEVHQLKEAKPFNCFDSIRKFSDALENTNVLKELQGYVGNHLYTAPLFMKLELIAYGRRKFAKLLSYFEEEVGIQTFQELSNNLIELGSAWINVRKMLIKMAFLGDISLMKERAVIKIKNIADREEHAANQILELCQKSPPSLSHLSNRHLPVCNGMENKNVIPVENVFLVDLSPHFNNKAFGDSMSSDCNADFNGTDCYFLKENIPDTETWKNGTMEFKISGFQGSKDNIACNGQIIPIQGGPYHSILILGAGDWGNFTAKLTVYFMNGQTEEIYLQFTDWTMKPYYGETVVWEGRGAGRKNGGSEFIGTNVRLFAQQYPIHIIDKIDSLQLPDCLGLHIFAITLG